MRPLNDLGPATSSRCRSTVFAVLSFAALACGIAGAEAAPVTSPATRTAPASAPTLKASAAQLHPEAIPGTLENLRVRVEELEKQVKILERQLAAFAGEMNGLQGELAAAKRLAAPPECVDSYHSKRPGAASAVACDPYGCEPSSGLCRTRCSATVDCYFGYVCDPARASCIRP